MQTRGGLQSGLAGDEGLHGTSQLSESVYLEELAGVVAG
jgi:hypothetical protein